MFLGCFSTCAEQSFVKTGIIAAYTGGYFFTYKLGETYVQRVSGFNYGDEIKLNIHGLNENALYLVEIRDNDGNAITPPENDGYSLRTVLSSKSY